MNELNIKIKYFSKDVPKLTKISKGDWIDLYAAETCTLMVGEHKYIPLGIAMQLPAGYEAIIAPRSSMIKRGIIMANSIGVIDNSYCGNNDQWHLSAFCVMKPTTGRGGSGCVDGKVTDYVTIEKGERLCQFRIIENQPKLNFIEVDDLNNADRGGLGSTGNGVLDMTKEQIYNTIMQYEYLYTGMIDDFYRVRDMIVNGEININSLDDIERTLEVALRRV